jgi:nucleotide-binding universal stress UspA family protein
MSPLQMAVEFEAWLETLSPAFLFLLVLPFAVGGVALAQYLVQVRREARRRVEANAVVPPAGAAAASAVAPIRGGYAMPKLLVPVDGSENALRAVRHAVNQSLAKGGLEAHLLYVRPRLSWRFSRVAGKKQRDSYHRELAEQVLRPARELLHRYSVPHAVHVESGDRAEAIHRTAQRLHVDRIVLGTARKNSLTRIFEDSVTSRLIEIARVPVEVIAGSKISRLERYGVPAGVGTAVAAVLVAAD